MSVGLNIARPISEKLQFSSGYVIGTIGKVLVSSRNELNVIRGNNSRRTTLDLKDSPFSQRSRSSELTGKADRMLRRCCSGDYCWPVGLLLAAAERIDRVYFCRQDGFVWRRRQAAAIRQRARQSHVSYTSVDNLGVPGRAGLHFRRDRRRSARRRSIWPRHSREGGERCRGEATWRGLSSRR